MSDDDSRFLSRWSQRKRQIAQEAAAAAKAESLAPEASAEPEEEPLDLSFLPKLEELTASTDLSLFMRKGVPETLRNAALRRMWALDPAVRDYRGEALDYAWDWNAPGGVPGGADLGADFDSREMVARIFGDAPKDENVIEDVAAHKEMPEAADMKAEMADNQDLQAPDEAENPAESDIKVQAHEVPVLAPDHVAPQKARRHGTAMPLASSKNIMS